MRAAPRGAREVGVGNKDASGNELRHHRRHGQNGRALAVTRKNFLFLGSDKGGDRAAIIYTALETARLNGIDPEAWLADVLDQLARGRSQLDLEALMPWNWRKPASLAIAA